MTAKKDQHYISDGGMMSCTFESHIKSQGPTNPALVHLYFFVHPHPPTSQFVSLIIHFQLIAITGTLMQICESANISRLHTKLTCWTFHIKTPCAREIYEKFVHKHSETMEYVKN